MRDRDRALASELFLLRAQFGGDVAAKKLELLRLLARARIRGKSELLRLHEALLFVRAFPDSEKVLEAAEAGLNAFAGRVLALSANARERLDESGIAGSVIHSGFSWPLVLALRRRFLGSASLFFEAEGVEERLDDVLHHLLGPSEGEAVVDGYLGSAAWLDPRESGAADRLDTMIAAVEALAADERARTAIWAALELPLAWELREGEDGSRTLNRTPAREPAYQTRPFDRKPVDLRDLRAKPVRKIALRKGDALAWIRAAQHATAARFREMHTFIHGNPRDVSVLELEPGLEIVIIGIDLEARYPVRSFYGYLLSRNGVPIGYGDLVLVLDWAEVNFHIFDTFRQGESSRIYALTLFALLSEFGFSYLFLNRYQFGHHNEDAIRSGAFWFYEKLGFRPTDPAAITLWEREKRAIAQDSAHRTSPPDLRRLARAHMHLVLERRRDKAEAIERAYTGFHPMNIALAWTRKIASEHSGDRRRALGAAIRRVSRALPGTFKAAERRALEQLAPALDLIPDLEDLTAKERRDLAEVVRAKASDAERDYLFASRKHGRLKNALLRLGRQKV